MITDKDAAKRIIHQAAMAAALEALKDDGYIEAVNIENDNVTITVAKEFAFDCQPFDAKGNA